MPRDWKTTATKYAVLLAMSGALVQCAPKADANPPRTVTGRIYDEFLEARQLEESTSAVHQDLEHPADEQRVAEAREALQTLRAAIASRRSLLDSATRDLAADVPNEALYFDLWSGHFGDGKTAEFRRLPGGGLEYRGVSVTKDAAVQCAIPAQQRTVGSRAFVDCLATLQAQGSAPR